MHSWALTLQPSLYTCISAQKSLRHRTSPTAEAELGDESEQGAYLGESKQRFSELVFVAVAGRRGGTSRIWSSTKESWIHWRPVLIHLPSGQSLLKMHSVGVEKVLSLRRVNQVTKPGMSFLPLGFLTREPGVVNGRLWLPVNVR